MKLTDQPKDLVKAVQRVLETSTPSAEQTQLSKNLVSRYESMKPTNLLEADSDMKRPMIAAKKQKEEDFPEDPEWEKHKRGEKADVSKINWADRGGWKTYGPHGVWTKHVEKEQEKRKAQEPPPHNEPVTLSPDEEEKNQKNLKRYADETDTSKDAPIKSPDERWARGDTVYAPGSSSTSVQKKQDDQDVFKKVNDIIKSVKDAEDEEDNSNMKAKKAKTASIPKQKESDQDMKRPMGVNETISLVMLAKFKDEMGAK